MPNHESYLSWYTFWLTDIRTHKVTSVPLPNFHWSNKFWICQPKNHGIQWIFDLHAHVEKRHYKLLLLDSLYQKFSEGHHTLFCMYQ